MLEIFNKLKPFFEDNYKRISVREYARMQNISPPNASQLLNNLEKEGLLKKEEDRILEKDMAIDNLFQKFK